MCETSGKYGNRRAEASLTIEAALSLTLFIFMAILLSVPMEILDTQRRVQMTLETAAGDELAGIYFLSEIAGRRRV